MVSLLLDPKFFNCLIMVLYALNAGRWALYGNFWDAVYWFAAFQITFVFTFGHTR